MKSENTIERWSSRKDLRRAKKKEENLINLNGTSRKRKKEETVECKMWISTKIPQIYEMKGQN